MLVKTVISTLLFVLAASTCFAEYTGSVAWVRGQRFNACKKASVARLIDGYMDNAKWGFSGTNANGEDIVKVFVNKSSEKGVMQFVINRQTGRFNFNALWIDNVKQPNATISKLINKMCQEI